MFTVFNAKGEATFETRSYVEASAVARARKQSFRYVEEEERKNLTFAPLTKKTENIYKDRVACSGVMEENKASKRKMGWR